MIETVIVRPAHPKDEETIAHIRAISFATDEQKVLDSLRNNPRYDVAHIIIAELGGQAIGTATLFPVKMWLSGVPVNVGAIAGVAVLPDYQGHGVAAKMMRFITLRAYSQRQALAALFPFSHRYYGKFGFRTVGDLHAYLINRNNINITSEHLGKVRPFRAEDLRILRVMYKGQMTWNNGWFTRSDGWWERLVNSWQKITVFDNDGTIEGYYAYEIKGGPDGKKVLNIKELFAPESEAFHALVASLARQSEAELIEYLAPPHTLLRHCLHQPTAHNAQNRGWIFKDLCHVTPGPMARIVNVGEAFTARFYTRGISGERVFRITDPMISANEEPIVFRLVDGRPETQLADGRKVQVETDVGTLTQLLCGYIKAHEARQLNRLMANEETCTWLDKIIIDTPLFIQAGDWF